jgi:hypothetical protein
MERSKPCSRENSAGHDLAGGRLPVPDATKCPHFESVDVLKSEHRGQLSTMVHDLGMLLLRMGIVPIRANKGALSVRKSTICALYDRDSTERRGFFAGLAFPLTAGFRGAVRFLAAALGVFTTLLPLPRAPAGAACSIAA